MTRISDWAVWRKGAKVHTKRTSAWASVLSSCMHPERSLLYLRISSNCKDTGLRSEAEEEIGDLLNKPP